MSRVLGGIERERRVKFNPTRNSTIFHQPTLGDFELQHLPVGVNDSQLEDRIIQHLAAVAAMGRGFPRKRHKIVSYIWVLMLESRRLSLGDVSHSLYLLMLSTEGTRGRPTSTIGEQLAVYISYYGCEATTRASLLIPS